MADAERKREERARTADRTRKWSRAAGAVQMELHRRGRAQYYLHGCLRRALSRWGEAPGQHAGGALIRGSCVFAAQKVLLEGMERFQCLQGGGKSERAGTLELLSSLTDLD